MKISTFIGLKNIVIVPTEHFQERILERFQDEDLPNIERSIVKAFEKIETGKKSKYTHPYYDITIVAKKMGLNGLELITCWKGEEVC